MKHLSETLELSSDITRFKDVIGRSIDSYLAALPPAAEDDASTREEDVPSAGRKRAAGLAGGAAAKRARTSGTQPSQDDALLSVELNGKGTKLARVRKYRCAPRQAEDL